MVVANPILYQVIQHLLDQRLGTSDARRVSAYHNRHAAVVGKARKPPHHALGGLQHIDKRRRLTIKGRLIKPRERQYLVNQRSHRLRLVVDEPRELLAVGGIDHVVSHKLGIPRYHLKRRLHLVAHVAREVAAHRLSTREVFVLLAKLPLLVVDSLEQRVHLLVNLVLERIGEVKHVDRLHNARRQPLR